MRTKRSKTCLEILRWFYTSGRCVEALGVTYTVVGQSKIPEPGEAEVHTAWQESSHEHHCIIRF
jgi:hypothetical protein